MKDCCIKWTGDNIYKIEPLEGDKGCQVCANDIYFCPECGSKLTQPKVELPREIQQIDGNYGTDNSLLLTYITNNRDWINQVIRYLAYKEKQ